MNTVDEPKLGPLPTRHAAEWGLASLLLGGVLAVMAMLTLQLNLQMFLSPRIWSHGDVQSIHDVAIAGAIVLGFLTIASIAFGIRGLVIAYKHGQPSVLGWAGLLISLLALLLWIGAIVDLFSVLDMLTRISPENVLKRVIGVPALH